MSSEEKHAIYGRLSLEIKKLKNDLSYLSADIKEIGRALEKAGAGFQRLDFNVDRDTATSELAKIWGLIERYKKTEAELSDKTAQFSDIEATA